MKTPPLSPQRKDDLDDANGDKDSSSNIGDVAAATNPSTSIGGRLTFYKDGKFIFQLAAHHQHQPYNNQSTITSPCRWVPVPTVLQQQKNNVKSLPVVITGSSTDTLSSPYKKYRSGQPEILLQHQRKQDVVDNSVKKPVLSLPQVLPANDHSITAILSGGESSSPPIVGNNKSSPAPYRYHTSSSSSSSSSSRKRSAVETTTITPMPFVPVGGTASIDHSARMSTMVIPPTANSSVVSGPSVALTALHQLPSLHLPNVASAAAADYFNVLYHQVAMAAIAYQTHPQLSKLQVPPSALLSSQYPSVPPSIVAPRMIHQQQQYQPAPMMQQQQRPLLYQHKQQQHTRVGAKKRTLGTMKYDGGIEAKNLAVRATVDEESSSSTDCMPLNLSKDSSGENVGSASTTTTVS